MTCPVCSEAVSADDDGVHAIGKNWHREHFVCTHCKCHFDDGVYFTKVRCSLLCSAWSVWSGV